LNRVARNRGLQTGNMQDTNRKLRDLMSANDLSASEVAKELDVSQATVAAWATEAEADCIPMPETELRLLQYALMTENRRTHLF
jgi:transcriptional regulator with XRE-family HTH domain